MILLKKFIFLVVGCVAFVLGAIGIFLPILPTVPFFMLTAFCLAKSSKRLHDKFIGSKMYKKHLKSFAEKKGMLMKTKLSVMTTVTVLMGFGFFMMFRKGIFVPCVILAIVWVCHIVYFTVVVKTVKE